ncbi:V-set and immunoglobulin domain-containing protein 4 [Columba livia]|uniref:V-set and immunoglobulin domain-containing protein 4 n=1 Tax=Columba livia TaxID=8932 RepID=UPI0031BB5D5C
MGPGTLARAAALLSPLLLCSASLDLRGPSEIEGVWKGSVTLPCVYVPVQDFVQQTLTWTVVHDQSLGTVFRRDGSGDHILLSKYRDRVSVPKDTPGNVSLHILNLEMGDRGTYTCQVTWTASNNSLAVKEITMKVEVVRVAVTKPVIVAGERGLTVPAGARTSLSCVASGSPPISYRWFRSSPGGKARLLGHQAELVWDSAQPSDSGTYHCEAQGRAGAARQSDAVQLTVTDLPAAAVTPDSGVGHPGRNYTTQSVPSARLPLHLVILIAVGCGAVVFLLIFLIICIRKPKDAQVYEVKHHNSRAAASSVQECTGHYEEPICFTENNYVMEPIENKRSEEINAKQNEDDCVGKTQESEYEEGDNVGDPAVLYR